MLASDNQRQSLRVHARVHGIVGGEEVGDALDGRDCTARTRLTHMTDFDANPCYKRGSTIT